jgi:hypothetical protein
MPIIIPKFELLNVLSPIPVTSPVLLSILYSTPTVNIVRSLSIGKSYPKLKSNPLPLVN